MNRAFISFVLSGITASQLLLVSCSESETDPALMKDHRDMIEHTRKRRAAADNIQRITDNISRFQIEMGRFPTNLYEIVRVGYIKKIPAPPPGLAYRYDPVYGNLNMVRMPQQQPPPGK